MQTLSDAERRKWQVDGYLHLRGVLSPAEVEHLGIELDRVRALPGWEPSRNMPKGHYEWLPHAADLDPDGFMDRRDLLPYGDDFINLIDRPGVFDYIVDIMGPNILFSMSQAIVRAATDKFPGYTHTDGGEALAQIRVTESSRPIAMKALYLLTDVDAEDCGALTVFPGSHMRPFPVDEPGAVHPHAPGAAQLLGKAGDCILFPHALWHGPAPNYHGTGGRKTLLYNYCQMVVRWYDFEQVADVLDRCTPRQRRLLGDLGYAFRPGSYFYVPEDQAAVIAG